jgi:(R,R)-butanediol dehydrogenase / meso-butanediol dehydrogenase / diacetyl reductase
MRAAVYRRPGDIRIEEVPEPTPGHGEVKIKVAFAGICGSDLHEYYRCAQMVPLGYRHPLTGVQAPVILGHEVAGTVVDIGPGVDDIGAGQLVAIEPIVACKSCPQCRSGAYNHCAQMAFHGFSTGGGGLAEYTVVARDMVHPVPPGVSPQQAALVEPLAVAWHAVQLAGLGPGDYCVVFGAGPIGLGAMFGVHAVGAHSIVVEVSEKRREMARLAGAGDVVDPTTTDLAEVVRELTDGRNAAACIDAAGVPATLRDALRTVGIHGRVIMVGVPDAALPLEAGLMFRTEASLVASCAYRNDFATVIEGVRRGDFPMDRWVQTIGLSRLVEDGFEALHEARVMKVLVDPTQ